jgi:hypothetical protein
MSRHKKASWGEPDLRRVSTGVDETVDRERSKIDIGRQLTTISKGEVMKKYLLGALITLTGLFVLAAGAQAETGDVVVHIKQDFIAGGKAFPAGTYKVSQDFVGTSQALLLRGEQPGESAFLVPTAHDSSYPKRLEVKLTRAGDVYYLSEVATEFGVYTLALPRGETRMATAKDQGTMSSSGSN